MRRFHPRANPEWSFTCRYLGSIVLSAWIAVLTCCADDTAAPTGSKAVLVRAAEVVEQDVPIQLQALGNVEATRTVALRSLVAGQIQAIHFTEGGEVKKGDLLVEIDPRPYLASLHQAQASLARDEAQARNAAAELARYIPLAESGLVSQDQVSQLRATSEALAATVQSDRAQEESARLQLGYCRIHAPITGVVGAALVDAGNIVKAQDPPLVTINEIAPIQVAFTVPTQDLPGIRRSMDAGLVGVQAIIPGEEAQPVSGRLFFVNNTVDPATGSIQLKATFDNVDRRLWPGQFVGVVIDMAVREAALVVPARALQSGQQGQFVYVILPDSTAELRIVSLDTIAGDLAVIRDGLSKGEKVVIDGQLQVAPGSALTVGEAAKAGSAP